MSTLYLCEKPSQARDIARVLGVPQKGETHFINNGLIITWCVGHLLQMAPPDYYCKNLKPWRLDILPVIPPAWQMEIIDKTKKQFNAIKKLLKEAKEVVIATDADREGETIAREILECCRFRGTIKRLWLSALDETSIKKALGSLKAGHETENLYQAGLARQRADWLMGMNLTMAATLLFSQQKGEVLSVGRVQTPTLRMVVERDHLIETFKPKDYFTLQVEFITLQQEKFWTTWENAATTLDENGYCVDRRIVECIIAKIKGQSAQVIQFEEKEKQEAPPIGLSLSTLQKIASSQLGLSAKQVLETAQSLYETHKATTYPRSDCQYLPESQWNEAKIIVPALKHIYPELQHMIDQCDLTLKSAIWNDKKITAHHAIIPTTNSRVNYSQFSTVERQVYDLICRYYLAQFLKPYLYASRVVLIECKNEKFSAACHTPIALGWCQAFTDNENKVLPQDVKIPTLSPGMSLMSGQERLNKRQTQPLARHTEGTLIDAMQNVCRAVADPQLKKVLKETAGIGTEATRANILEILFKRGYLIRQGKLVVSTPKGRHLIASLPQIMTDPVTTAQWEQEFDAIANNQRTLDSFISQQTNILQNLLRVLINHPH